MIAKNCGAGCRPSRQDARGQALTRRRKATGARGDRRPGLPRRHRSLWVIRAANAYVDHQAPCKQKKENPPRMGMVHYVLAETIR